MTETKGVAAPKPTKLTTTTNGKPAAEAKPPRPPAAEVPVEPEVSRARGEHGSPLGPAGTSRRGGGSASSSAPKAVPREENVVFVGSKPPMNYVLAIVAVLTSFPDVIIRARGNAISQAVTVAEIVRNKFVKDAKVKNVAISTDRVVNESGRPMNVSAIEIVLTKAAQVQPSA